MELRLFVPSVVSRPTDPTGSFSNAYTETPGGNPIGRLNVDSNIQTISPFVFNVSSHLPTNSRIRSSILRAGQVRGLPLQRHPCPLKVKSKPTAVPPELHRPY